MKRLIAAGSIALLANGCISQPTLDTAGKVAVAKLVAAPGSSASGTVTFTQEAPEHLKITTAIEGLEPGPHGFHVHEIGNCNSADFSTAGGHFNPEKTEHGSISSTPRHHGDLGNIIADKNKKATSELTIHGLNLDSGPHGIIGRSIMIHQTEDDLKSQPAGNSGKRIACGVIELAQ